MVCHAQHRQGTLLQKKSIRVRAGREQKAQDLVVSTHCSSVERGPAIPLSRVGVGSMFEQPLHSRCLAIHQRTFKRNSLIDIRSLRHQRSHLADISARGGRTQSISKRRSHGSAVQGPAARGAERTRVERGLERR